MSVQEPSRVSLDALTSFRFFAALGVLIAHDGNSLETVVPEFVWAFFATGGSGILFFFILSGFILVYANRNKDLSSNSQQKTFFFNRFARIAPLYYLALSLGLVNLFVKGIGEYTTGHVAIAAALKYSFLHAWSPWHVRDPEWLMASWTLSVEAFFYAVFPFTFLRIKESKPKKLLLLSILVVSIAAIQMLFFFKTTHSIPFGNESLGDRFHYYFPGNYIYAFVLGMCAGLYYVGYRSQVAKSASALFWVGCGLCLVPRCLNLPIHHPVAVVGYHVGSVVLILGLTEIKGVLGTIFKHKWLILLGEASYALYLFHGPIHTACGMVFKRIGVADADVSVPSFLVYTAITIVVSIASFLYIETPAKKWLLNRRNATSSR